MAGNEQWSCGAWWHGRPRCALAITMMKLALQQVLEDVHVLIDQSSSPCAFDCGYVSHALCSAEADMGGMRKACAGMIDIDLRCWVSLPHSLPISNHLIQPSAACIWDTMSDMIISAPFQTKTAAGARCILSLQPLTLAHEQLPFPR
eukprot:3493176-Amphidinium_carterae.1